MAVDPRWEANQRVAQAAAGSANELVEALAAIIESDAWREFVHPMHGVQRYERFPDYCDGWVHISAEAVATLCDQTDAKAAARTVRRLIGDAIPKAAENGTNQYSNGGVRNTNPLEKSDTASTVLARLKRDRPDLAAQVIDGTLSAHQAALKAGIRKPRASFRTDDPDAAMAVLLKHYTPQQITAALAAHNEGETP